MGESNRSINLQMKIFQDAPDKTNKSFFENLSKSWLDFMRKNARLGFLLEENTYKEDLTGEKIRLLHVTPSIEKLKKSGKINSSGGGLGSVIYCCPLHKDFRPHNLFYLYHNFQLPKKINGKKIGTICIEIESKFKKNHIPLQGIDYTLFGKIHCSVWNDLKFGRKNGKYFLELEEDILNRVKANLEDLNLLISYKMKEVGIKEFKRIYNKVFMELPELRFILYETLAEYILLHQNNKKALEYAHKREFFNENHKKLIWDLCPTMLKKFNMKNFIISLDKISSYLKKRDIILNFNENDFHKWIKWRISYYFLKIGETLIDNQNNFENLMNKHPYLIGQILYRAFHDKHLFEILRSKYLYKDWEKKGIILPIYSIIPKGEMGINPNLDKLNVKYSIYEARTINDKIKLGNKLDLKISPDMIKKSEATVR